MNWDTQIQFGYTKSVRNLGYPKSVGVIKIQKENHNR